MKKNKSTVMSMYEECDWGKTLYNACYIFNRNLADYWIEYVKNYNNNKEIIHNAETEAVNLAKKREDILNEKKRLKDNVKYFSGKAVESYRKYIKTLPIGECVHKWRKYQFDQDYQNIIEERKNLHCLYSSNIELKKQALIVENNYKNNHLFETRELGNQAKSLKKLVDIHKLELAEPLINHVDIVYNFITSDEQIERLMGVCVNILNTYSEKEFSTLMYLKDRENIADHIFDYFSNFKHNYDFIVGCYQIGDDNKLHLKDIEVLKNKFYNGYYLTIRGFVQRSYIEGRNEHFNVMSADANWEEDEGNGNHGIDVITDTEKSKGGYSVMMSDGEGFSEGMFEFWKMCKNYLYENVNDMANELLGRMNDHFSSMEYYANMKDNTAMVNVLINTIDGINAELEKGHNVNMRLKHIILDSMGGAETKDEWNKCSLFVLDIIKNYINKFFVKNRTYLYDDIFEKRFDEKEWNTK